MAPEKGDFGVPNNLNFLTFVKNSDHIDVRVSIKPKDIMKRGT